MGHEVWPSPQVMQAKNFAVKYPQVWAELVKDATVNHVNLDDYVVYACEKHPGSYGFNAALYPLVTAEAYAAQREQNDGTTTRVGVPEYLWFSIEGDVSEDGTLTRFEVFAVTDGEPRLT